MKFRRLTETEYNGFAGAEPFADSSNPFIADLKVGGVSTVVIAGFNGMVAYFEPEPVPGFPERLSETYANVKTGEVPRFVISVGDEISLADFLPYVEDFDRATVEEYFAEVGALFDEV